MGRCTDEGCWWALLHLVLVIPDICGALEADDGQSSGAKYQDWCRRCLPTHPLGPIDRYMIRCSVLHQGSSLPHGEGLYESVSFVQPGQTQEVIHQVVSADAEKENITLDVKALGDEMVAGLEKWFLDLQESGNTLRLGNVTRNLRSLVRVQPKKPAGTQRKFLKRWCRRRESNPHGR